VLGRLADQTLALVGETDDRGGDAIAAELLMSTLGEVPSMTATQELVVPRSMPMILDMVRTSSRPPGLVADRLMNYGNGRAKLLGSPWALRHSGEALGM
jgi:hypothetical protein